MDRGGGLLDLLLRGQGGGSSAGTSVEADGSLPAGVSAGVSAGASAGCSLLAGVSSGTLSAGSSRTTLSAGVSGTETAALGSAVGVWTSVFSGVCWVSLTVPSPPSTEAISSLACATELSSGFMT